MSNAMFVITDGTTEIDFLDEISGFHLADWNPAIAAYKGGGVFQDSPQADGRRLVDKRFMNAIETLFLKARDVSQDALIYEMQEVRRLFEKAAQYWTTSWQNTPVYIKARATNETNIRYAIIYTASIPEDDYPYGMPFLQPACASVMDELTLIIERGPWLDNVPGVGTCVEIAGYGDYCWPCHVEFNGSDTQILVGDNAAIQDLHDAAMTYEAWIRPDGWGEESGGVERGSIGDKTNGGGSGWLFSIQGGVGLRVTVLCAVDNAVADDPTFTPDGQWHHVAFTWDDATYTTPRIWVDGVDVTTAAQARNGAITTDVGFDLYIGEWFPGTRAFDGGIGWCRISDTVRYNTTFTPPLRCILPDPTDPNTVAQWIGAECSGATIDNQEGTAALDGTLSNGTFDCECPHYYGNIGEYCGPAFLEFNALNSIVDCGSAASLDDLPDFAVAAKGQIVVDAWVRADGYGGNNQGVIAAKSQLAQGWIFWLNSVAGLEVFLFGAAQNAISRSGLDEFSADGQWHHVLFVYDETGTITPIARTVYLAIDGVWVTSYVIQQPTIGNYVSDAAGSLYIGNIAALSRGFDGDIGWLRVRDALPTGIVVNTDFTAPVRCTLPASDGDTLMLIIHDGVGLTTWDKSANGNDGTITLATWGCDCVVEDVAINPTCLDQVYFANKHNEANITNVHYWDSVAGTWSANLMGAALPFDLLPAVPAAGDVVIFGIDTSIPDSGPFYSLVFDLLTAQTDLTTITWRYSDAGADPTAWGAITFYSDNTNANGDVGAGDPFDTTGTNSVHWRAESAWAVQDPQVGAGPALGVTGYWVAAHVVAVGAVPASPVQQNGPIYSVTWPFVEIAASEVGGDIPALIKQVIQNQSDGGASGINTLLRTMRIVAGLRSVSRGALFTSYINFSNIQNPTGISVITSGAGMAFGNDVTSVTGRVMNYTGGLQAVMSTKATISFTSSMARNFYGKYHAYVRYEQTAGNAGDITARIVVTSVSVVSPAGFALYSTERATTSTDKWNFFDFGRIQIPPTQIRQDEEFAGLHIHFQLTNTNAAATLRIIDLILIPVDEWAIDTSEVIVSGNFLVMNNSYAADIDSVTLPRIDLRTYIREIDLPAATDEGIAAPMVNVAGGPAILQANARQRLWFFISRLDNAGNEPYLGSCEIVNTAVLTKAQRYLSMRGDR